MAKKRISEPENMSIECFKTEKEKKMKNIQNIQEA